MEGGKNVDNSVWKKQRNLKRTAERTDKQKKDQKQQIPKINPYNPQEAVCGCCQDINVQPFLFFPALCH